MRLGCSSLWIALVLAPALHAAGAIDFQTDALPPAIQGWAYDAGIRTNVDGRCPSGTVTLFVAGGSLPRGLRTTLDGIVGIPRELGRFRFWIGARNTCASTVRVYELLVTGRPILRAVPERIEFTVSADGSPESRVAIISSTWPGLPYRLSTLDAGLTFEQAQGTTPELGSALTGDRVTVVVIPKKLPPGIHHAVIVVSAWRADAITIDVTITVAMPAFTIPVLPLGVPLLTRGATDEIVSPSDDRQRR